MMNKKCTKYDEYCYGDKIGCKGCYYNENQEEIYERDSNNRNDMYDDNSNICNIYNVGRKKR